MHQFTEQEKQEICNLYKDKNKKLLELSKYYHCRTEAIKNILIQSSILLRKRGQQYNYNINESFFEEINSEESAYFLGLLFADGNISYDTSGSRSPIIRIGLKVDDEKILTIFKEILGLKNKIIYDKRINKESAILSFRNNKIAQDLSKYGIIPRKTYLTKHLPAIDKKYCRHFLRGLIDGDGSIFKNNNGLYCIDFCSYHKTICEEFRNLCNEYLTIKNNNIIANYGSAFHIRFTRMSSVKELAKSLYCPSNYYLERKKEIVEEILN